MYVLRAAIGSVVQTHVLVQSHGGLPGLAGNHSLPLNNCESAGHSQQRSSRFDLKSPGTMADRSFHLRVPYFVFAT